jgi:site-specific DNA-methyltransferase (adenine-specific)
MRNYFQKFIISEDAVVFWGDTVKVMSTLQPESVDVIFADPPYFLSNGGISVKSGKVVSVDKGEWDKIGSYEEMHKFNFAWIRLCKEILKEDGTIWISGTHHNIYSIGTILKELGFHVLNQVIWVKTDPPPNISKRMFTYSYENIIWAKKNKSVPHTFHYELMKKMNKGKQMTDVWHIPHVPMEEKTFGYHPTQKPLQLVERIVVASSNKHSLILDPFCGSGTTGVAALKYGRRFIGIDNNIDYVKISFRRINHLFPE